MTKLPAIVFIMFIGAILASSQSCSSCGSECVSSCGSRRFRACCFNYLRKKRGPEVEFNKPLEDVNSKQQWIDSLSSMDSTTVNQKLFGTTPFENYPYFLRD